MNSYLILYIPLLGFYNYNSLLAYSRDILLKITDPTNAYDVDGNSGLIKLDSSSAFVL
jgi:hypothetical protein